MATVLREGAGLGAHAEPTADAVEQLRRLHYDIAGPAFPREVPALLGLAASERLLFGSDYCWTPPPVVAAHLAAVDASEPPVDGATWRTLTTANAHHLFPRLADTT